MGIFKRNGVKDIKKYSRLIKLEYFQLSYEINTK